MSKPLHELGNVILATETHVFSGGQVLVFQRSPQQKRYPGYIMGVGGRVNAGEDVTAAAVRKIKHEPLSKSNPAISNSRPLGFIITLSAAKFGSSSFIAPTPQAPRQSNPKKALSGG